MSDAPASKKPDSTQAQQTAWLERVLDVRRSEQPLSAQVDKLAAMPRPDRAPSNALTGALLSAAKTTALPEDDADLPDVLAEFAPRFLAAAMDEPAMSTHALGPGAPIPAQDQMLGISGLLDALGRKLERWDAFLDEAEEARTHLSGKDAVAPGSDDYAATVDMYRDDRARGLAIEAEVAAMLKDIRAACAAVAATAGEAAP